MKQVITKQGKTFYYSEILLFNRVNDNIAVIINDKEQLDKFSLTGNIKDAPIAVIPYSEDELKEIVSYMKPIAGYTEFNPNKICVEYSDTALTRVEFAKSNKEIIENNLIEQRKFRDNNSIGNWYEVAENKETSAAITEEQRFKVLQFEKCEKDEKDLNKAILAGFISMSFAMLSIGENIVNGIDITNIIDILMNVSLGLFSNTILLATIYNICSCVNVNKDKEKIRQELQDMGINLEKINESPCY